MQRTGKAIEAHRVGPFEARFQHMGRLLFRDANFHLQRHLERTNLVAGLGLVGFHATLFHGVHGFHSGQKGGQPPSVPQQPPDVLWRSIEIQLLRKL